MARTQSPLPVLGTVQSVPFVELRQSLPSRIEAISPFLDQLMRFILNFRNADGTEVEIEMALREALANAVIHGNRENSYKRVHVECRCNMDGEVSITVRDEGQGFESSTVPDPTTPENRLFTHGRGIYLMKTLMGEVSFEQNGAIVHMRKRSNARSAAPRRAGIKASDHSPLSFDLAR
jgi:serine/threonine-protein kinase RsbW